MELIGISMMDNSQKGKYIVVVDCVNLVKSMDCQLLEICERSRDKEYSYRLCDDINIGRKSSYGRKNQYMKSVNKTVTITKK